MSLTDHRRTAAHLVGQLRRPTLTPVAFALLALLLDMLALTLALWFAGFTAFATAGAAYAGRAALLTAGALAAPTALALLICQIYALDTLLRPARSAALAWLGSLPAALAFLHFAGPAISDAAYLAFAAGYLALGLGFTHWLVGMIAGQARDYGLTDRIAVLVGGGHEAAAVLDGMKAQASARGIRIVGLFDDRSDARSPDIVHGIPKLGRTGDLVEFARRAPVDMAIIAFPLTAEARIREVTTLLRVLPVDIRLPGFSRSMAFGPSQPLRVGADGLIVVADRPLDGWARLFKRLLDLTVAGGLLVVLSPVLLLTAAAIRLDSPGPVFFRQRRHGYNNSEFEILKFRSMFDEASDAAGQSVVTRGDARVTRVGRFLRRSSIDELPQLINVLRGDLSLVGPRPHVVDAVSSARTPFEEIVENYAARHRVPPGLTGWAQVNGWRGEIDRPERLIGRVEHDLYYMENRSFWFDIYILLRTIPALIRTDYAY